jgi:hypothetical protein
VSSGNLTHPIDRCKSRSLPPPEISDDPPAFPRSVPLSDVARARRLAELREVLADAAPSFQGRLDADRRGARP